MRGATCEPSFHDVVSDVSLGAVLGAKEERTFKSIRRRIVDVLRRRQLPSVLRVQTPASDHAVYAALCQETVRIFPLSIHML